MDFLSHRSGPVASGVIPSGAGGIVGFEDFSSGISGGSDYHRAYETSMMARFAPDTLAASVRRSWDEPWLEEISPAKPQAVSMVGTDVFGPASFHSTTRNSMLDLRGEAAYSSSALGIGGEIPTGASEVSWAAFANPNTSHLGCGTCSSQFMAPALPSQPFNGAYKSPASYYAATAAPPYRPHNPNLWTRIKSFLTVNA